jgi:nitrogen fixation protein FixH
MTTASTSTTGFRITGWHVLIGLVAFFAVVIAVDAVMMTLAYRTHPGQVSVTPYEDGLAYNKALAQKQAQARLGWSLTADIGPSGRLEVQVADAAGSPVRGLAVTALMQRPATEDGRFTIRLVETMAGHYVALAQQPPGAWDADIDARDHAGNRFMAERRMLRP